MGRENILSAKIYFRFQRSTIHMEVNAPGITVRTGDVLKLDTGFIWTLFYRDGRFVLRPRSPNSTWREFENDLDFLVWLTAHNDELTVVSEDITV